MKLTQELIDKIQEAMLHTNLKGEINWKDDDDIEVQIAGTFAKDKFIVLKNVSKNPFENAQPHPYFDYDKKVFTKDGSINWKDDDEVVVQLAGTFAADRFIVIKNKTKDPVVSAAPHPDFDYEKKVFTKDGREEYMKEYATKRLHDDIKKAK